MGYRVTGQNNITETYEQCRMQQGHSRPAAKVLLTPGVVETGYMYRQSFLTTFVDHSTSTSVASLVRLAKAGQKNKVCGPCHVLRCWNTSDVKVF